MRKLMFSLLAGAAGVLGATNAQATVIICGGTNTSNLPACPNAQTDNILINSADGVPTITGSTQPSQGGVGLTITGNENLTGVANGQAKAGATDNTTNYLMLDLDGDNTFGYAEFSVVPISGNADNEATSMIITYYIPGAGMQTVEIKTNGETKFGLYGDAGERFTGFSLSTDPSTTNFDEIRQIKLEVASPTNVVPEPGTWAMMLLGFGAVGFGMRRRRQSLDHAMQIA